MAPLYALLVGIDAYREPLKPLKGCRHDVDLVGLLLSGRTEPGDLRLRTLVNEQATRNEVIRVFREHLGQARAGDTAMFWFSGHGSTAPLLPGMPYAEGMGECQTTVCFDSRHGDVPDLYDKELAVLVHEVVATGAHLLTVQDCCFSGSGTRDVPDTGLKPRLVEPAARPPTLEQLMPELRRPGFVPGAQATRHVALSACQSFELANESESGPVPQGAFTQAMVAALNHLGRDATYREVLSTARCHVENQFRLQIPTIEPAAPGIADQVFLGGVMRPPPAAVTMRHLRGNWEIDIGSLHGVAAPAGEEQTWLAVHGSTPVQEVRVTAVYAERSVVTPVDWSPATDRQYPMVLTRVPLPAVAVVIDGDPCPDARTDPGLVGWLTDAIHTVAPGRRPSPHVRLIAAHEAAGAGLVLRVRVCGEALEITSADGKVLATAVTADAAGIRQTVDDLEHIARWLQIRHLSNPRSRLQNAIQLEVIRAAPGESFLPPDGTPEPPGAVALEYRRTGDGWVAPSVFVRLRNTHDRDLHCVLLDLTDLHRMHADLFPGEPIAARSTTAAAKGKPIELSLPPARPVEPGRSGTDWFMVLAAEDPFSAAPFYLPRLRETMRGARRGGAITGVLDRLGLSAQRRDADVFADVAGDWATTVVEITTSVPGPGAS